MLLPQRIPLTEKEFEAIDDLIKGHDGNASLARRDPGETGPVIVEIDGESWEIDENGKTNKVN